MHGDPTQLGNLIGRSHRPQHRKIRPAACVSGKPDTDRRLRNAHQVEQPRPDKGVGGRTMHHRGADLGQTGNFAVGEVDRVTIKATFAQQSEPFVGVQIIAAFRKERFHPFNLGELFAQVCLHQAIRVFGPQGTQRL